jgi:hypothetical protein
MVRVAFWLQFLLLVLLLKQSDAASDQCRELQEQISRLVQDIAGTTQLKHGNESLACQSFVGVCYIFTFCHYHTIISSATIFGQSL